MHASLLNGATLITLPKFEPELFLSTMATHKISIAMLVPPIILFLTKSPLALAAPPLPALRMVTSGAAPLDAATQLGASAALQTPVVQGYGMVRAARAQRHR